MPYLFGLGGLGVFWIVLLIATRKHPWALVIGEDGQASTSKFQMLLWTGTVVFGFLAIFTVRFSNGFRDALPGVPTNLLIAMGISIATAVSAKSIAVSSQARSDAAAAAPVGAVVTPAGGDSVVVSPIVAPLAPAGPASKSGIFTDDSGAPDLAKVQVVLWTLIGVGVFLSEVISVIQDPRCPTIDPATHQAVCNLGVPDIGQTLMILMGLGNGAYIGKKIAES